MECPVGLPHFRAETTTRTKKYLQRQLWKEQLFRTNRYIQRGSKHSNRRHDCSFGTDRYANMFVENSITTLITIDTKSLRRNIKPNQYLKTSRFHNQEINMPCYVVIDGHAQEMDEDILDHMVEALHNPTNTYEPPIPTTHTRWKPDGNYEKKPSEPDYVPTYHQKK